MFVAVVVPSDSSHPTVSGRIEGDFSCFLGETKKEAALKGILAAFRWAGVHHCNGSDKPAKFVQYGVFVGELTEESSLPIEFVSVTPKDIEF